MKFVAIEESTGKRYDVIGMFFSVVDGEPHSVECRYKYESIRRFDVPEQATIIPTTGLQDIKGTEILCIDKLKYHDGKQYNVIFDGSEWYLLTPEPHRSYKVIKLTPELARDVEIMADYGWKKEDSDGMVDDL